MSTSDKDKNKNRSEEFLLDEEKGNGDETQKLRAQIDAQTNLITRLIGHINQQKQTPPVSMPTDLVELRTSTNNQGLNELPGAMSQNKSPESENKARSSSSSFCVIPHDEHQVKNLDDLLFENLISESEEVKDPSLKPESELKKVANIEEIVLDARPALVARIKNMGSPFQSSSIEHNQEEKLHPTAHIVASKLLNEKSFTSSTQSPFQGTNSSQLPSSLSPLQNASREPKLSQPETESGYGTSLTGVSTVSPHLSTYSTTPAQFVLAQQNNPQRYPLYDVDTWNLTGARPKELKPYNILGNTNEPAVSGMWKTTLFSGTMTKSQSEAMRQEQQVQVEQLLKSQPANLQYRREDNAHSQEQPSFTQAFTPRSPIEKASVLGKHEVIPVNRDMATTEVIGKGFRDSLKLNNENAKSSVHRWKDMWESFSIQSEILMQVLESKIKQFKQERGQLIHIIRSLESQVQQTQTGQIRSLLTIDHGNVQSGEEAAHSLMMNRGQEQQMPTQFYTARSNLEMGQQNSVQIPQQVQHGYGDTEVVSMLEKEFETLRGMYTELFKASHNWKDEWDRTLLQKDHHIKMLESRTMQLMQENEATMTELTNSRSQLKETKWISQQHQKEASKNEEERQGLQKLNDALKNDIGKFHSQKRKLELENATLKERFNPSHSRGKLSQQEKEALLTEISVLKVQMTVFMDDFNTEKAQRVVVENRNENLKKEKESLKQKYEMKLKNVNAQLKAREEDLRNRAKKMFDLQYQVEDLTLKLEAEERKNATQPSVSYQPPSTLLSRGAGYQSGFYHLSNVHEDTWTCKACTFNNKPDSPHCEICHLENPGFDIAPNEVETFKMNLRSRGFNYGRDECDSVLNK